MRLLIGLLLFAAAAAAGPARAQGPTAAGVEYQVKAAFLLNFAKFVEWPAGKLDNSGTILLGVYGEDPFGAALEETVRGKTVKGKALVIHRLSELREVKHCHILFVSSSEKKRLERVLRAAEDGGVLTVGVVSKVEERVGMINLVTEAGKISIEVNLDAAERAGIKISSKLLRVARVVQKEAGPGRN